MTVIELVLSVWSRERSQEVFDSSSSYVFNIIEVTNIQL